VATIIVRCAPDISIAMTTNPPRSLPAKIVRPFNVRTIPMNPPRHR
jgi:hypothetical protein